MLSTQAPAPIAARLKAQTRAFLGAFKRADYDSIWNELITPEAASLLSVTAWPCVAYKRNKINALLTAKIEQFPDVPIHQGLALAFQRDVEEQRTGLFRGVGDGFEKMGWHEFSEDDHLAFLESDGAIFVASTPKTKLLMPFVAVAGAEYRVDFECIQIFSMSLTASALSGIAERCLQLDLRAESLAYFELAAALSPAYLRAKRLIAEHPVVNQFITSQRRAELLSEMKVAVLAEDRIRRLTLGGSVEAPERSNTVPRSKPPQSAEELLNRYAQGERDFSGATLVGAKLDGITLVGASLRGANLQGASFSQANFRDVDLRESVLDEYNGIPADLAGCKISFGNRWAGQWDLQKLLAWHSLGAVITDLESLPEDQRVRFRASVASGVPQQSVPDTGVPQFDTKIEHSATAAVAVGTSPQAHGTMNMQGATVNAGTVIFAGAAAPGAPTPADVRAPAASSSSSRPTPNYPDAETRLLSEKLADAQARKLRLQQHGADTTESVQEILDLKRRLREGGQLKPGDSLGDGRHLLLDVLGRGGFATVWRTHDAVRDDVVAVKVLHSNLAGDRVRLDRFKRGARIMASWIMRRWSASLNRTAKMQAGTTL